MICKQFQPVITGYFRVLPYSNNTIFNKWIDSITESIDFDYIQNYVEITMRHYMYNENSDIIHSLDMIDKFKKLKSLYYIKTMPTHIKNCRLPIYEFELSNLISFKLPSDNIAVNDFAVISAMFEYNDLKFHNTVPEFVKSSLEDLKWQQ